MSVKQFLCKDRVCAIVSFLFGVWVFLVANKFPKSVVDSVGSAFFPKICAGIIMVASVILFITAKPAEEEKTNLKGYKALGVVFGDMLIYILLWDRIGFILSTLVFLTIFIMYFETKYEKLSERFIKSAPFIIIFTIILYLLFGKVLGILLPTLFL